MKSEFDFAAPLDDPIAEQAIAWFARMHSDLRTRADEDRFTHWLGQDQRHSHAYQEVKTLWRANGSQIMPRPQPTPSRDRRGNVGVKSYAAIAAALVVVISGTILLTLRDRPISRGTFATATGAQQELKLSDGSTVILNTSSEVSIELNKNQRSISLLRGEARFKVAKDSGRPFVVEAGAAQIRALGTAFDVRVSSSRLAVTLVNGKVAVTASSKESTGERVVLTPGQQLALDLNNGTRQVHSVNLDKANAWLNRQLIFDALPLSDAVEEVNRYLSEPITIRDVELAAIRISGVVRAGSEESLVRSLESSFPVQAVQTPTGIVLVQKTQL